MELLFAVLITLFLSVIMGYVVAIPFRNYYRNGMLDNPTFRRRVAKLKAACAKVTLLVFLWPFVIILATPIYATRTEDVLHDMSNVLLIWMYVGFTPFISMIVFNIIVSNVSAERNAVFNTLQYGPYGRLKNWTKATRALRNRLDWTERFTNNAAKVIASFRSGDIDMLAPSSNSGEYEFLTAEKTHALLGTKINVYASDFQAVMHIAPYEDERISFRYISEINGYDLREIHPTQQFDVIYDVKGFVWHASDSKKRKGFETAFQIYHDLLKPGGIVIIDGYTNKFNGLKSIITQYQLQFFGHLSWFGEQSTFKYIGKHYKHSELMKRQFMEYRVDDSNATLICYRKM